MGPSWVLQTHDSNMLLKDPHVQLRVGQLVSLEAASLPGAACPLQAGSFAPPRKSRAIRLGAIFSLICWKVGLCRHVLLCLFERQLVDLPSSEAVCDQARHTDIPAAHG